MAAAVGGGCARCVSPSTARPSELRSCPSARPRLAGCRVTCCCCEGVNAPARQTPHVDRFQPAMALSPAGTAKARAVYAWLQQYELREYFDQLRDSGYNSMRFLVAASEDDIREVAQEVSMKRIHAKVFVDAWAQLVAAQGNDHERRRTRAHSEIWSTAERAQLRSQPLRPLPDLSGGFNTGPTQAQRVSSAAARPLPVSGSGGSTPTSGWQRATIAAPTMRTDEVQVCLPYSESQLTSPKDPRNQALSSSQVGIRGKFNGTWENRKYPTDGETADEKLLRLFNETDTDGGGTLDMKEIKALCRKLGDRMSNAALHEAFERMDPDWTGEVGFQAFRRWRKLKTDMYRRELRNNVRQVFEMTDEDGSGMVDKKECGTMMVKIGKAFKGVDFDPPFSLEEDFAAMDVQNRGEVSWEEFLDWFMQRTGDDEPDIPVLPEYMVRKVVDVDSGQILAAHSSSGEDRVPPETEEVAAEKYSRQPPATRTGKALWNLLRPAKGRTGRELWSFLRPRLGMLVKLQKQWGSISSLYSGKRGSTVEEFIVPRYIRDPDSPFCAYWDLVQVFGEWLSGHMTFTTTREWIVSPLLNLVSHGHRLNRWPACVAILLTICVCVACRMGCAR